MRKIKKVDTRDYLVDNLKVILIFTVVFGHTIEYYINQSDILKGAYIYIYLFHMPLFIFISGYLSKKRIKSSKIIVKKLLIPYVFFNTIWYIGVYIVTGKNMFSLLYPGWTLWYLVSLFFWRISLKYITKIKYIVPISFMFGLLIGLDNIGENFLSLSRTIAFLPFFLIGYYTTEENLYKINKLNKLVGLSIIIIFIGIAISLSKHEIINYKFLYNSHAYHTNNLEIIDGILFRIILYIFSIVLSIGIINLVPNNKVFYSKYGKNTMNVYLFHIYLIIIILATIPTWDISIIKNLIIIISPFFIMLILSLNFVNYIYKIIFNPLDKLFDIFINTSKKLFNVF